MRLSIFLLLFVPAAAVAQNTRVIALPDTLGANFNVADTLTATSQESDYDFLMGTWRFKFQSRNRKGEFQQPFNGLWVFEKKNTGGNGTLIEDHFRPDDNSTPWEAGTWTYRVYNSQRKIWEMQGISTFVGSWQPGWMWRAGNDRLLTEWYGTMLVRFRYFAIEENKFLWRADATFDRGKTWLLDYWTMEVTRVAK